MSDPLIDAANAISNSSPRIRQFAQLAAQRIVHSDQDLNALLARVAKLEQAAPTPPPSSTKVGNGYVLFRYGNSWTASPVSGYERYGVVVVGYGNDADAAKLTPALGCGYRTPVELEDVTDAANSTGGVTLAQARANGWLLEAAPGVELHPNGYPAQWCGNLSHPGYQAAWIATVKARMAATGLKACFLDNVVPAPYFTGTPANIYGGMSFEQAYLSFLTALKAALPTLYLLANAGPGGSVWWQQIAPHVDGAMVETFTGTVAQLTTLQAGKANGLDVYALAFGDPSSSAVRAAAQSFATVWNQGDGGGFGVNLDGADPWNTNWTSVIV